MLAMRNCRTDWLTTCAGVCWGQPVSEGTEGHEYCDSGISNYNFKGLPLPQRELQKLLLILQKNKAARIKNILIYPFCSMLGFPDFYFVLCRSGNLNKSRSCIIIFSELSNFIIMYSIIFFIYSPVDGYLLYTVRREPFSTHIPAYIAG